MNAKSVSRQIAIPGRSVASSVSRPSTNVVVSMSTSIPSASANSSSRGTSGCSTNP